MGNSSIANFEPGRFHKDEPAFLAGVSALKSLETLSLEATKTWELGHSVHGFETFHNHPAAKPDEHVQPAHAHSALAAGSLERRRKGYLGAFESWRSMMTFGLTMSTIVTGMKTD